MIRWQQVCVGLAMAMSLAGIEGMAANDPPPDPETLSPWATFAKRSMFEKLGRGVGNVLGGWLEIPLQVHRRWNSRDTATSLFAGLGMGLVKGLERTAVGLFETVTFFHPDPNNYAPLLPPLEYYERPKEWRKPLPLQ